MNSDETAIAESFKKLGRGEQQELIRELQKIYFSGVKDR